MLVSWSIKLRVACIHKHYAMLWLLYSVVSSDTPTHSDEATVTVIATTITVPAVFMFIVMTVIIIFMITIKRKRRLTTLQQVIEKRYVSCIIYCALYVHLLILVPWFMLVMFTVMKMVSIIIDKNTWVVCVLLW